VRGGETPEKPRWPAQGLRNWLVAWGFIFGLNATLGLDPSGSVKIGSVIVALAGLALIVAYYVGQLGQWHALSPVVRELKHDVRLLEIDQDEAIETRDLGRDGRRPRRVA